MWPFFPSCMGNRASHRVSQRSTGNEMCAYSVALMDDVPDRHGQALVTWQRLSPVRELSEVPIVVHHQPVAATTRILKKEKSYEEIIEQLEYIDSSDLSKNDSDEESWHKTNSRPLEQPNVCVMVTTITLCIHVICGYIGFIKHWVQAIVNHISNDISSLGWEIYKVPNHLVATDLVTPVTCIHTPVKHSHGTPVFEGHTNWTSLQQNKNWIIFLLPMVSSSTGETKQGLHMNSGTIILQTWVIACFRFRKQFNI